MHRSSNVIRPKTKIRVQLQKDDGTTMDGFVFVGGQERVLDLLNNADPFMPFQHDDGRYVMINKQAIAYAWPEDDQWMGNTYSAPPSDNAGMRRPVG